MASGCPEEKLTGWPTPPRDTDEHSEQTELIGIRQLLHHNVTRHPSIVGGGMSSQQERGGHMIQNSRSTFLLPHDPSVSSAEPPIPPTVEGSARIRNRVLASQASDESIWRDMVHFNTAYLEGKALGAMPEWIEHTSPKGIHPNRFFSLGGKQAIKACSRGETQEYLRG